MLLEGRRYHVLEAVGKGGFGTVYRAELVDAGGFKKQVALKVLNPELADSAEIAERLRDEARMLGLLRHRAVVRVDGMLLLNDRWTVVMEYVDGVDLKRLLSKGPVPTGCAVEIVLEVAAGLYAAYALPAEHGRPLRVLHRDIKPSNIQLTRTGDVKVLDFGVARADFQHRESVTRSIFFGSLNYMAPERLDGIDTHAGDVYALGAVLYELVLGEALGRTSGNEKRHQRHLDKRLGSMREHVDDPVLCKIVEDCLSYDAKQRPPARELERRLRAIRVSLGEPWLADYSELVVPELIADRETIEDDLSGSILVEQGASPEVTGDPSFTDPRPPPNTETEPRPIPRRELEAPLSTELEDEEDEEGGFGWGIVLGLLAAISALVGVVLLGGGGVTAFWVATQGEEGVTVGEEVPAEEGATEAAAGEGTEEPGAEGEGSPEGAAGAGSEGSGGEAGTGSASSASSSGGTASSSGSSGGTATNSSSSSKGSGSSSSSAASGGSSSSGKASSGSSSSASSGTSNSGSSGGTASTGSTSSGTSGGSTASTGSGSASSGSSSIGTAAPEPEPETVSSPPASGGTGSVFLTGDTATVRLLGGPRIVEVPGPVPAGSYTIEASFGGGSPVAAGSLEVADGQRITLSCRASLKRCIAR